MSVPSALPFPASSGVALFFAAVVALPFTITTLYTCAAQPPQQRINIPLLSSSGFIIDLSSAAAKFASDAFRGGKAAHAPSNEGPMNGIFVPFLWTQKYNSFKGYAFGFWGDPIPPQKYNIPSYDFYLCVCLGQINNEAVNGAGDMVKGRLGTSTISVEIRGNSLAVPVWTANLGRPLAYVNASLNVRTAGPNRERALELRDGDGSLAWRVIIGDDGAFMALQESGNLVIFDSANRTVWQSFQYPTDTLLVRQNFSKGMSLTSRDSVFSVAMEPRGLVFYLINSSQTGTTGPNNASFWILSSTLATSYPFVLRPNSFSIWADKDQLFCQLIGESQHSEADLVRLDRDGRLRFYTLTQRSLDPINTLDALHCYAETRHSAWGACDVPMECGLCLPNASGPNPCTCPAAAGASTTTPVFKQIDQADAHKGCTTLTSNLSSNFCASSSNVSTLWDFLEVKDTATIFQFCNDTLSTNTPWTTTVPNCKEKCLNDCSCLGVIFNDNQSLCFTMTDHRLSLVQVPTHFNLSYTTFLKVGAAPKHHSITVVHKEL